MPRSAVMLMLTLALLMPACRSNDKVEAELRHLERENRELRGELTRLNALNYSLELAARSAHSSEPGLPTVVPPANAPIAPAFPIQDITFGRGTGGLDVDRQPGDEGVQVVIVPRDADEHAQKIPGSLVVTAAQISAEGLKLPLCGWEVSANDLRTTWRAGLFSTGYTLTLLFKQQPVSERLRLVARFTLLDGKAFEAEKDITIRLSGPRPPLTAPLAPAPPIVEIGPALPAPKP